MADDVKVFYYHFRKMNGLAAAAGIVALMLVYCAVKCPFLFYWPQVQVLCGVFVFACLMWGYLCLLPHRAVVIDNQSIKIDHCRPLLWKDIKNFEEKVVRCGWQKRKVLVLNPKKNIKYHYNFLQKHNCGFSAFSIPLYHILREDDERQIMELVAARVRKAKQK